MASRLFYIYFVSVISKSAQVTSFQDFTCNYKTLKLQLYIPTRLDMIAVIL